MRKENIKIDLYKKTYSKLMLKQYDTTQIECEITNENFSLVNKIIKYIFRRIDGSIIRDLGTTEENKIIFDLDEKCLQLNGQAEFEVQIYDGEELISSFLIPIEVEPSNMDNAEAVDKGLYLQDIDKTYNELKEDMEDFEEAEEGRAEAEEERERLAARMAEDTEDVEELIQTVQDKLDNGDFNGPANVLSIGNVTSGTTPSAEITGDSPRQVLNLVLPKGDTGEKGDKRRYRR